MINTLYVAWRYVAHNKVKTTTLVACITLIGFLPLALEMLLNESEHQLLSRANSTPLLIGAKGSALDLTMNTLYFSNEAPELITTAAINEVVASNLAMSIPIYARFHARDYPIIGTSLDYFDFRGLKIETGRSLAILGECVIGARVANDLNLTVGDSLISSPETAFNIAGVYPLKMKIVGVLKRTYTADDLAVFVDLKTAWVIQGLGHGHEDLAQTEDTSIIMDRRDNNIVANAKMIQFTEVTESNIDEFHFHGDTGSYPISGVVVVPKDSKSGTILRGRYIDQDSSYQIVNPKDVIERLLENIFRIRNILNAVIIFVGTATLLAMILVFVLSLRLRQREIETIFNIGCSRLTITRLLVTEVVIIILISTAICALLAILLNYYSNDFVRVLFVQQV